MNDASKRNTINIHNHGFVSLVDTMGDDAAIVQAARVSYGKGTKTTSEDRGLIRYLIRHKHCYHPDMEVLTIEGWKKWKNCREYEYLLVPDPVSKKLLCERRKIKAFYSKESMHTYKNSRMSYCVTPNHTMWFKEKHKSDFGKVKIDNMPQWGHFESIINYVYVNKDGISDLLFELIGFFLGDGSWQSTDRISFHLMNKRKINYLKNILLKLNLNYTVRKIKHKGSKYKYSFYFYVETPDEFYNVWFNHKKRTSKKEFNLKKTVNLTEEEIRGLWRGLVNSDGYVNTSRHRVDFYSTSIKLIKLFELLGSLQGYETHRIKSNNGLFRTLACRAEKNTLESRKQYHGRKNYEGKVFCATTSTGLLMVRGSSNSFSFVCGNSTPLEMVVFKFHIKLPIFVMRQWIRHRMSSTNEYSARYSEMKDEFYIPDLDSIHIQSLVNKQGRAETENIDSRARKWVRDVIDANSQASFSVYQALLSKEATSDYSVVNERSYTPVTDELESTVSFNGIARELARAVLPVNVYTECYWKIDLHNLFHFLKLRTDSHAQKEIRDYADAICELIKPVVPMAYEAWVDYAKESYTMSRMEMAVIKNLLKLHNIASTSSYLDDTTTKSSSANESNRLQDSFIIKECKENGMSSREISEFISAFSVKE